jgi:hypothetical protein
MEARSVRPTADRNAGTAASKAVLVEETQPEEHRQDGLGTR